jgi:hypothetical protein
MSELTFPEIAEKPPAEPALLTSSRLRCFRTCARLHQLRYVEGWRPRKESEALRFGSLFHRGLEAWWTAAATTASVAEPLAWALAAVDGLAADVYEQVRIEELLRGYDARWRGDSEQYEVLGVEVEYRAPLLNPATNFAKSRTWRLAGKIDAVVRRRADGRVLVVEHKTTVEEIASDADHYWSTLALDHQISGYVIGAESLGHVVDEILYDVAKKPGQRPAKATPLEVRKYTKDGRLYANQRAADETPEEYRGRIRAEIDGDLARHYQRRAIPRTESQIRDFLFDAWQQGRSMRETELAGYAPRNPEACHRFGTCPFWLVCSTGLRPSDYVNDYDQVNNVNPELGKESA